MEINQITVKPLLGNSGSGKPIYGTAEIVNGRIEPSIRRVSDEAGNEVVAGGFIMLESGVRYKAGSVFEWEGKEHKLIKLAPIQLAGENFETHVEGWFK